MQFKTCTSHHLNIKLNENKCVFRKNQITHLLIAPVFEPTLPLSTIITNLQIYNSHCFPLTTLQMRENSTILSMIMAEATHFRIRSAAVIDSQKTKRHPQEVHIDQQDSHELFRSDLPVSKRTKAVAIATKTTSADFISAISTCPPQYVRSSEPLFGASLDTSL